MSSSTAELSRVQALLQQLSPLQICSAFQEFTLFPKLPPEVRNTVWRFAAFEPQLVHLRPLGSWGRKPEINGPLYPPAILHASYESRTEAKRYYTECQLQCHRYKCGANLPSPDFDCAHQDHTIFVNFSVDRFYYCEYDKSPWRWFQKYGPFNFRLKDMARIQHLVLHRLRNKFPAASSTLDRLQIFKNVQDLKDIEIYLPNYTRLSEHGDNLGAEIWLRENISELENRIKTREERYGTEFAAKLRWRFVLLTRNLEQYHEVHFPSSDN